MNEISLPHTIGKYTLTQRLGQGGMGVVYVARDERLGRDVALKMIAGLQDERSVKRFWREARAAAAVDETEAGIYLAMELLAGEPLDARIRRSPCSAAEAVHVGTQVLAALSVLHDRGIVHRDIKPSNIFLTLHGVKLLDFGLARHTTEETLRIDDSASSGITRPGMVVGTPRYMAPEQVVGQPVDARADLFALGVVLFEMLAGRPPFNGETPLSIVHAILHEHPPALQGSPAIVAIDRVIRRAMAKNPAERYPIADAMAAELRAVPLQDSAGELAVAASARALLRLVVPPLRLNRDDNDASFLSYGLAEAVSGSLAALRDVVVRAPSVAASWTSGEGDPRALATAADVDYIVSGSLTRMANQLRATMQLVEARNGTVVGATTLRGTMDEVFAFEDAMTQAVISLLTPVRSGSTSDEVRRDTPANARAFEQFLRGLELARQMSRMPEARECFIRALDEDPAFAPAWAWLGRCHRVIGKFVENHAENDRRAEDAFRRALALSPDLPVAHRFYTHFESEHGRADAAIARLLQYARTNRNDAQLFAALVHACRYAGLLGASFSAHEEARRLDPTVPTSVEYSLLLAGDADRLRALPVSHDVQGAQLYMLLFAGRMTEAVELLDRLDATQFPAGYRGMIEAVRVAHVNPAATLRAMAAAMQQGVVHDPEAVFLAAMTAAVLNDDDSALAQLTQCVQAGYSPVRALETSPILAGLRPRRAFGDILELARQRRRIAQAVFARGAGPELLGLPPEQA
jgi:TolB-like protein